MPEPWWTRTTVYEVYLRSFCDSNGDGIGDLPGLISKLDYLRDLGVETLWICPFYLSPMADAGYDISDYEAVSPEYGTMDDVRRLVDEAHARGLRVVADMVLNHTSEEHAWFRESRQNKTNPKRDWYIWRDGKEPNGKKPPNNWRSILGPSGWTWDETTEQWYWASFLSFQPDLNYRNPAVQEAMLNVVRKWLAFGFDGLRLDIFYALFKDEAFRDNPPSLRPLPSDAEPDGFFQSYRYILHHPDTRVFARTLRRVVDEFENPPRFLVGEAFGQPSVLRGYCEGGDGLHTIFLFKAMQTAFTAKAFRDLITEFEAEMPAPLLPTWVFGSHDRCRLNTRRQGHPEQQKLCAALQFSARGIPFLYYGEEIGLPDLLLPHSTGKDPVGRLYKFVPDIVAKWLLDKTGMLLNRDACRTPMLWSSGENGGFCPPDSTPWLPAHPSKEVINVEAEERDPSSILSCYRKLLAVRKEQAPLSAGTISLYPETSLPPEVLGFRRQYGEERVVVLLHFDDSIRNVKIPDGAKEVLFSSYATPNTPASGSIVMRPYEAIFLR